MNCLIIRQLTKQHIQYLESKDADVSAKSTITVIGTDIRRFYSYLSYAEGCCKISEFRADYYNRFNKKCKM